MTPEQKTKLDADIDRVVSILSVRDLALGYIRYEKLRLLNTPRHAELISRTLAGQGSFNELVDRLGRKEVTEPPIKNCRKCFGDGQVEIQSGPYMRECPECNGTGKQTDQPKP